MYAYVVRYVAGDLRMLDTAAQTLAVHFRIKESVLIDVEGDACLFFKVLCIIKTPTSLPFGPRTHPTPCGIA